MDKDVDVGEGICDIIREQEEDRIKASLKAGRLRGVDVSILGDRDDIANFEDVAFLEMPDLLVEQDADGPFLKVVTEKAHYKIRLEKDIEVGI